MNSFGFHYTRTASGGQCLSRGLLTDNSLFINIVALTVKEVVCHEENISAEQQKAQENARVPGPHENRRRPESPQEPKGQG
jgi:hypothetical protein